MSSIPTSVRPSAEAARLGVHERRLRVVEFPVTPYVQWEFFVLRIGESVRAVRVSVAVVDDLVHDRVTEDDGLRGAACALDVRDLAGVHHRDVVAQLHAQAELIAETSEGFDELYARAEPFSDFFEREIAPLPPPASPRS
ncbi:DUF6879 family protein [Streptomyces sp. NPDC058280]|uniref:DUF6879 family protein n=1 Tax=Streptomyces sp. NPDC058280 TaxID=3346419 RepID=UPI0036EA0145